MPNPKFSILVIDDQEDLLLVTAKLIEATGYQVAKATCGQEALAAVATSHFDVCVVDMMLGVESGLEVMQEIKKISPYTECIVVTAYASVESAVQAMSLGAFQYLSKPVDNAELMLLLKRAVNQAVDARDKDVLAERLRFIEAPLRTGGMIVESANMQRILEEARAVAQLDKPIFIHGETGTGKELIANFIHQSSPSANEPFNVVNCGTLTENLVDVELFGCEKGAFTGADAARPGLIAASDGGTLFLDEIGDIPEPAQVRLLRFLEGGVVRPVGATRERKYDVRIISASHQDLRQAVVDGTLREDLFHRLVVFELSLPPLRERYADIVPLANHFLQQLDTTLVSSFSDEVIESFQEQPWPGNIRELRNEIERAWLRAHIRKSTIIEVSDLAFSVSGGGRQSLSGFGLVTLSEAERLHVEQVLSLCDGNKRRAAKALGISERHIYRLLK